MSKICDVENMYGQDFSIVTTNAPTNVIKNPNAKLLANTILICSPNNANMEDNNYPALFATDYNAKPLQLTYPLYMKNGLSYSNELGYAYINIDNKTITTYNNDGTGPLKVNTNNLAIASFSTPGVVKVKDSGNISRIFNINKDENVNNEFNQEFHDKTFINIDNSGVLYLDDNFFNFIQTIVDSRVKEKINFLKEMMNINLKMWIEIKEIDDDPNTISRKFNIGSLDKVELDNNKMTKIVFDLHYYSFENVAPKKFRIEDESNKIYNLDIPPKTKIIVNNVPGNDELFEHVLENIKLVFLPNYFIINNSSYDQNFNLVFDVNDNKSILTFVQNKFQFVDNEQNRNFYIDLYGSDTNSSDKTINANDVLNNSFKSFITARIGNINIFKDIIYNGNDDVVKYEIKLYIKNNYNDEHYLLYSELINFVNEGNFTDVTITAGKDESAPLTDNSIENYPLYDFINGIVAKDSANNYITSNGNYKIDIDKVINNNISARNFIDPLDKDDNNIEYKIYILAEFIVTDKTNSRELGRYVTQAPYILDKVY